MFKIMEMLTNILFAAIKSGTPILYATIGEILTERSGILNLGLEGLMLIGAISAFITVYYTSCLWLGVFVAFLSGCLISLIHAFLCITLRANQIVSGIATVMFGTGLSALLGKKMVGETIKGFVPLKIPLLSDIPILGKVLFSHDVLVYLSYSLVIISTIFLFNTKWGLYLRSSGENPRAVDAMGISVNKVRYIATVIGGGITAIGGAYLSIAYTQMWIENMTAGKGWIAVALVIFAIWHPLRAALGAYLFGGVGVLQLYIQAAGSRIPAPLLLMLPYVLTIVVLLIISIKRGKGVLLGAPASLGIPYDREERT